MPLRLLCSGFLIFLAHTSYSQSHIKGQVVNEKTTPIPNASVALLSVKDSSLVMGDITDQNGNFSIKGIDEGEYLFLISSIGYDRKITDKISIRNDQKNIFKFTVQSRSKQIREVNINASKPIFEQRADKLIVNVANSPVSIGGTAQEVLKKVPGVVIVQDKITLGGGMNLQIWIDGRPSLYTDMQAFLRSMPGDQIDKVELIRQPGAKYDAAGGPILNIILKKNARQGFHGTTQLALTGFQVDQTDIDRGIRTYGRVAPSINGNYRKGDLNLFFGASYSRGENFRVISINRFIGNNIFKSPNLTERDYDITNLRFGLDYAISKRTSAGVVLRGYCKDEVEQSLNPTSVFEASTNSIMNEFNTENRQLYTSSQLAANFNIKHQFDTLKSDHNINFDLDLVRYRLSQDDNFQIYNSTPGSVRSLSQQIIEQPVNILTAKIDYSRPFDSSLRADIGFKSSLAAIDNQLSFFRSGLISPNESNHFLYHENINATYLNLHKEFNKIELNLGLRAEQTIAMGETNGSEMLNRNYIQLFPNASVLYRLNKQMGIQAAYTKRISRPSFNQQNPFRQFIDSLTYQSGNTNLSPEISHSGQLAIVYEGQPFLSAEYSLTDDVIIENAPRIDGNKTFTTAENLAKKYNWTFQANFPLNFGKTVQGYGGNQLIMNSYQAQYLGSTFDAKRWHWLAYINVTFQLPNEYAFEVNGFYLTKFLEEFITIDKMAGIDLALTKSLWEKRGRVTFACSDMLYSQKVNGLISYQDVRAEFQQRDFSQNLRLTFSYSFGNTKLKRARSRNIGSDAESRVKIE